MYVASRLDGRVDTLPFIVAASAFAAGGVFLFTIMFNWVGLGSVPGSYLLPFIPGACIGTFLFITEFSHARGPYITVVMLCVFGLMWADGSQLIDGFLFLIALWVTMGMACLFCAPGRFPSARKWFLSGYLLSTILLLLDFLSKGSTRLGTVVVGGSRVIEPNQVGTLSCVAFVLIATIIWNQSRFRWWRKALLLFALVWILGVIVLSGSRGSLITIAGAMLVFLLAGRGRWNWQLVGLGFGSVAISLGAYWQFIGVPSFLKRFTGANVGEFGGRTQIWAAARDITVTEWGPFRLIFGEGTGSAANALGSFDRGLALMLTAGDKAKTLSGAVDINAHSSYVEWWLTFGCIGAFIGFWCIVNAAINARRVDKKQAGSGATALLVVFLMTSFTLIAYRMAGVSIAAGAIALAAIYLPTDGSVRWYNSDALLTHCASTSHIMATNKRAFHRVTDGIRSP